MARPQTKNSLPNQKISKDALLISSKAFDQSNQMHSIIPEKTQKLLLTLLLYAENFKIRNSTVESKSSNYINYLTH
jgi:hypothetical protein